MLQGAENRGQRADGTAISASASPCFVRLGGSGAMRGAVAVQEQGVGAAIGETRRGHLAGYATIAALAAAPAACLILFGLPARNDAYPFVTFALALLVILCLCRPLALAGERRLAGGCPAADARYRDLARETYLPISILTTPMPR